MSWKPLLEHADVAERLQRALARDRLASTFLFVGPAGVGKRTFAIRLAGALLCQRVPPAEFEPCGECPSCQQVLADSHPDLEIVEKPANKAFLPIELFVGDREHRGRAGLCHQIALKPACGGYRIGIIDDADFLNLEGANCLLKTLEEPPPNTVLILIGTSQSLQLPTILSRCQVIRFGSLSEQSVAELLQTHELCEPERASELARASGGSLLSAQTQAGLGDLRNTVLKQLAAVDFNPISVSRQLNDHINQSSKDAAIRRRHLREAIRLAIDFYGALMRRLCEDECEADAKTPDETGDLAAAVESARGVWQCGSDAVATCLDLCVDAELHVASNANLATLIECWLDDLAGVAQGRNPAAVSRLV